MQLEFNTTVKEGLELSPVTIKEIKMASMPNKQAKIIFNAFIISIPFNKSSF